MFGQSDHFHELAERGRANTSALVEAVNGWATSHGDRPIAGHHAASNGLICA
jgi:hypothetical protein